MADTTAEIRLMIEAARNKFGETFDFKLLEQSWGDTLDDDEMLQALKRFDVRGRYLDTFLAMLDPGEARRKDEAETTSG